MTSLLSWMAPFPIRTVSRMSCHRNMNNTILLKFGTKVQLSISNKNTKLLHRDVIAVLEDSILPKCSSKEMWPWQQQRIHTQSFTFNPILPGGGGKIRSLLFFLHHPKTAQGINLKLSDFKDTPLRHILQVKPVRLILSCCYGNKIKEGTSQDLAARKRENQPFVKILS